MTVQFKPHTLGTVFALVVKQSPLVNMSAIPVTLVLDTKGQRITLRFLNGGTDGVLTDTDRKVRFEKPPTWSAANLKAGVMKVYLAFGAHATAQQLILYGTKEIIEPDAGSLPVAEAV